MEYAIYTNINNKVIFKGIDIYCSVFIKCMYLIYK